MASKTRKASGEAGKAAPRFGSAEWRKKYVSSAKKKAPAKKTARK